MVSGEGVSGVIAAVFTATPGLFSKRLVPGLLSQDVEPMSKAQRFVASFRTFSALRFVDKLSNEQQIFGLIINLRFDPRRLPSCSSVGSEKQNSMKHQWGSEIKQIENEIERGK